MPRLPHTSRQAALVFTVLLEQPDRWRHGYELMQATSLKSGSLYPMLIRLSDDGLLDARWQTDADSGRPRREYRLNTAGRSLATERIARFAVREGAKRSAQQDKAAPS